MNHCVTTEEDTVDITDAIMGGVWPVDAAGTNISERSSGEGDIAATGG